MSVDASFADWLKADARYVTAPAAAAAAWGDGARETTIVSPLALQADAAAEAANQAAILAGPLAIDEHDVPGARVDLVGRCVTIAADRLGYGAGRACLVVGATEKPGFTTLTVATRL